MGASYADKPTVKRRRADGNQPEWVTIVTEQVAAHYNRTDLPTIAWRYSKKAHHSSGLTHWEYYPGTTTINRQDCRVVITQGKCRMDALLVLMHELSHWIDGYDTASHGTRFWRIAWHNYKHFGLPLSYAFAREAMYRKEAIHVATEYLSIPTEMYRRALRGDMPSAPVYRTPDNAPASVLGWEAIIGYAPTDTRTTKYISRDQPLPPITSVRATFVGTNESLNSPQRYSEFDLSKDAVRHTTDGGKTWHPGFAPTEETHHG